MVDKNNKVAVLALLEAYRIKVEASRENHHDHAIRVCQAIVARAFGYTNRADWTGDIKTAGLIDYGYDVNANEQYKALTAIVNNIKMEESE